MLHRVHWFFALGLVFVCPAAAELKRKAVLDAQFAAEEGGKLVLRRIAPQGNAARAGLADGDIVVSIDGKPAEPAGAFVRPYLKRDAGGRAVFVVERAGMKKTIDVAYGPLPKEAAEGLTVEYASVPVRDHERRTLLTIPKTAGRHPAILFLAGSGCGSQESPAGSDPQVALLYEMTRKGYITMRVEKTGSGDSSGPPCYSAAGDLAMEADGYRAGFEALTRDARVNPARIFLLGHSAGGTLAPLAARGLKVSGIAVAGAMGTTFKQYILDMRRRERTLEGLPPEDVEKAMAISTACLTRVLDQNEDPLEIEKSDPRCRKQVRFDSPPKYVADWHRLNLSDAWAAVPAPVLVVYGSGDFVTSEAESRALVARINKGAGREQARLLILPMDHGMLAHSTPERAWRAEQGIVPGAGLLLELAGRLDEFYKAAAAAAGTSKP